jgi:pimeloyl-ACP methyl ester carboxylesterase
MQKLSSPGQPDVQSTIQKTLLTSLLFEGFWDRWIAHGIERESAMMLQSQVKNLEDWVGKLEQLASEHEKKTFIYRKQSRIQEAENSFRLAGLHYNLIQWIFPDAGSEKRKWYERSMEAVRRADSLSVHQIDRCLLNMGDSACFGRVRIPKDPKGAVIMINPFDSSKEELFTYETDFADAGFVTLSFDGPGQGATYVYNQFKATRERWSLYVDQVIRFAAERFPDLPIYLFGTSSGASWAIHGSAHPKVRKAVSVSPALPSDLQIPDYFKERMMFMMEKNTETILPDMEIATGKPVFVFHGKKDVMVKEQDIYRLVEQLPPGKKFVEYENEGHCCNFKLKEVRSMAVQWFLEDK